MAPPEAGCAAKAIGNLGELAEAIVVQQCEATSAVTKHNGVETIKRDLLERAIGVRDLGDAIKAVVIENNRISIDVGDGAPPAKGVVGYGDGIVGTRERPVNGEEVAINVIAK